MIFEYFANFEFIFEIFCQFRVVSAASQQTLFIVSGSLSNAILGKVNQMLSRSYDSPGVSAASQQTLFIVSGFPSNPILGEVNQMLCWGRNSPGVVCCFAANSFYCLRLPIQSNPRGGNPNASWGLVLLRSKLFLLSPAPHPI